MRVASIAVPPPSRQPAHSARTPRRSARRKASLCSTSSERSGYLGAAVLVKRSARFPGLGIASSRPSTRCAPTAVVVREHGRAVWRTYGQLHVLNGQAELGERGADLRPSVGAGERKIRWTGRDSPGAAARDRSGNPCRVEQPVRARRTPVPATYGPHRIAAIPRSHGGDHGQRNVRERRTDINQMDDDAGAGAAWCVATAPRMRPTTALTAAASQCRRAVGGAR